MPIDLLKWTLAPGLAVVLAACGQPADPGPVASPTPSAPLPTAAPSGGGSASWLPAAQGGDPRRRGTPVGRFEGHGLAWLEKLGGSPKDYPGPAAVVGPLGGAVEPTLALAAPAVRDLCTEQARATLGAAAALDLSSCGGPDCVASLEAVFKRGADLALLTGNSAEHRQTAARLASSAAEATDRGGPLLHVAVPTPLDLSGEGLWRAALEAELLSWSGDDLSAATPERHLWTNLVARSLGRRGLLHIESKAPASRQRAELARVGLHLATGGATRVGEDPAPPTAAALAFGRAHPELFARHRAPAGLLVPVDALISGSSRGATIDQELLGIVTLMAAAGFPVEPVLVGDDPLLPVRFQAERLSRLGLILVPASASLPPAVWEQIAEGAQGTAVLVLGDEDPGPLPQPSVAHWFEARAVGGAGTLASAAQGKAGPAARRWAKQLDEEDEQLIDTARRSDGAVDGSNLPDRVLSLPSWHPESGSYVQHFVDAGAIAGGAAPELEGGLRVETPLHSASNFDSCEATLHLPGSSRRVEGTCSTRAGNPSVWSQFEGLTEMPAWSVLVVRLLDKRHPERFGVEPITLEGTTGPWSAPTVAFRVPFLDDRQVFSLSLPEFVRVANAGDGFEGNIDRWDTQATIAEGGRTGRFVAVGQGIRFEADVQTKFDRVELAIEMTNESQRVLEGVEALLCASSRGASPFPESGHGKSSVPTHEGESLLDDLPLDGGDPLYLYRSDLTSPRIAMQSTDGTLLFGHAFDGSVAAGGNGSSNGVCLHSRPSFGDLPPGASVTRRGMLYLGPEGGMEVPGSWAPGVRSGPSATPRGRTPCDASGGRP